MLSAAAAGIKRTTEVEGLYTTNYLSEPISFPHVRSWNYPNANNYRTEDSVGLIVWSSAEMAITLICIGIPVCRPLYKRAFRRMFGESSFSANYPSGKKSENTGENSKSGDNNKRNSVPLRTIGGGLIGSDGKPLQRGHARNSRHMTDDDTVVDIERDLHQHDSRGGAGSSSDDVSFTDVKLGVNGPFTTTTVGGGNDLEHGAGRRESAGGNGHVGGHASDEEMLEEYRNRGDVEQGGVGHNGIMVTETYRVERS